MTLHLSFPSMYKSRCQGIKVPFENKVMGLAHRSLVSPCHSFFPFFCFSLSVLLSGWLLGAQGLSEFTFLPGLLRPDREGALRLHLGGGVLHPHPTERAPVASVNRASSVPGAILAFCVNQGRSSPVLSLLSFLLGHHPENTPGSCWGWTPAFTVSTVS